MQIKRTGLSLTKLKTALRDLDGHKIKVGWGEQAKYDEGTPAAGIAAVQEFGSPSLGIPPRPFIRPTIEQIQKDMPDLAKKLTNAVISGKITANQALNQLGLKIEGDLRKNISLATDPPLSPVTIAIRGFKNKNPDATINRTFVNKVRQAIERGETGKGQLGDQSFRNKTPLNDTGFMLASITSVVEK